MLSYFPDVRVSEGRVRHDECTQLRYVTTTSACLISEENNVMRMRMMNGGSENVS